MLAGLAFLEMLSQYPQSVFFEGFCRDCRAGSAAVCDPDPPCPFARLSWVKTRVLSDGVRVQFRVRFQAVKVPIFGGFPVENPTKKANRLKALLRGISLSEYGSERF